MDNLKLRITVHMTALTLLIIPRLVVAAIVYGIIYLYGWVGYTYLEILVVCIVTELAVNGIRVKYKQVNNAINTVIEKYNTTE